jgi:hypothetical protein
MTLAICVIIVLANLQMGPPVNLALITNSTKVSELGEQSRHYITEHIPQLKSPQGKMDGRTKNDDAGTLAKTSSAVGPPGPGNTVFIRKMVFKDGKIVESIMDLPE